MQALKPRMGFTFAILRLVLELPDSNWVALVGRLICKDADKYLGLPHHCTVRLSLPLPPSALDPAWQPHVQRAFRQLTESDRRELLPAAASSGSETNLELAWGLMQPCLLPAMLTSLDTDTAGSYYATSWYGWLTCTLKDAGGAAIAAGHVQLLPWLVRNRCPMSREGVLSAAAEHLDLEGVQRVAQLLGGGRDPPSDHKLRCEMAKAAARSGDAAIPTLAWLLSDPEGAGTQLQQQEQEQQQDQGQ